MLLQDSVTKPNSYKQALDLGKEVRHQSFKPNIVTWEKNGLISLRKQFPGPEASGGIWERGVLQCPAFPRAVERCEEFCSPLRTREAPFAKQ